MTLRSGVSLIWCWLALVLFVSAQTTDLGPNQSAIYTGNYQNGAFDSLTFVNSALGWDQFFYAGYLGQSTVVANVEAGTIWYGHEVFNRATPKSTDFFTYTNPDGVNEVDFHATAVGNILGGSGYVAGSNPSSFTYVGLGMAPKATLWSGGIASAFSTSTVGSFDTTTDSLLNPYIAFFNGINGRKADVINSSWGTDDPGTTSDEMVTLDSLAWLNPTVAFVAAAGNGGSTSVVSAPGSNYNNLAVGSTGGSNFRNPSSFSSATAADFYNPQTGTTLTGVRAAVDLAAPGERMALAAYLGSTGSLGASSDPSIQAITMGTPPTDQYFVNFDGTSFAAPFVSGGIALLKDVANTHPTLNYNSDPNAEDTRVLKSILMAGSDATAGWNNGQTLDASGTVVTTQALDYTTGAGLMDLNKAVNIYFFGTRDAAVTGGSLAGSGWDFNSLTLNSHKDYVYASNFSAGTELTVSLNWFANQLFNGTTNRGASVSFTNLDLELWKIENGVFSNLVARSATTYNNSEFLRLTLPETGLYGLRVLNNGLVFDLTGGTATSESYGLAWDTTIPTPTVIPSPTSTPVVTPTLTTINGPDAATEEGDIPTWPGWAYTLTVLGFILLATQRLTPGSRTVESNSHQ